MNNKFIQTYIQILNRVLKLLSKFKTEYSYKKAQNNVLALKSLNYK